MKKDYVVAVEKMRKLAKELDMEDVFDSTKLNAVKDFISEKNLNKTQKDILTLLVKHRISDQQLLKLASIMRIVNGVLDNKQRKLLVSQLKKKDDK